MVLYHAVDTHFARALSGMQGTAASVLGSCRGHAVVMLRSCCGHAVPQGAERRSVNVRLHLPHHPAPPRLPTAPPPSRTV